MYYPSSTHNNRKTNKNVIGGGGGGKGVARIHGYKPVASSVPKAVECGGEHL